MSNTDASVPWGRPAVDSIPLPPFGTAEERTRFTRALQLHVALVDDGAPSLASKPYLVNWRTERERFLDGGRA
ncbi:hypothetical protein AB0A73_29360 [Glycomyces sp. NPDC047369]